MSATFERSRRGMPELSDNLASEIKSLELETQPTLRRQGRLHLAGRLEAAQRPDLAAPLYAELAADPEGGEIARKGRDRLASLRGEGPFGYRVERLLGRVLEEAGDPRLILPMMAGSIAFGVTRTALLARMGGMAGRWTGRGLAAAGGFSAEVGSFSLLQRSLSGPVGSFGEELRHSALSLGMLKLSTSGLSLALKGISGPGRRPSPQLLGFLGLFTATQLEQKLGWRPAADAATNFADSLATYFSLEAGARLGRGLLGARFRRWEAQLARSLPETARPQVRAAEAWARSGSGALSIASLEPLRHEPLWMSSQEGGRPPEDSGRLRFRSVPPARVRSEAADLRKAFTDANKPPYQRLKKLEEYLSLHQSIQGTKAYQQGLKDLLRTVLHPAVTRRTLREGGPVQAVPYYAYQHQLRVAAAAAYVQSVERLSYGDPYAERGVRVFREVLQQPRVKEAYRPSPKDTEAQAYYLEAEKHTRMRLLPLYARLLYRMPIGSPEVSRGLEMLSEANWLQQLKEVKERPEGFASASTVARAYAYLVDAATPAQRKEGEASRRHLLQWIPFLESKVKTGKPDSVEALIMLASHEKPAEQGLETLRQTAPAVLKRQIETESVSLGHREKRRAQDMKRRAERIGEVGYIRSLWNWVKERLWLWD